MRQETINKIDSIVLNGELPISEKMYQICLILGYEVNDDRVRDQYCQYYENLLYSRIPSIETFDYDNNNILQPPQEEGYNWG